MHAWEQIQITLDYIEEHLGENIEIEGLAKTAALSPFYYQRLFCRLVKKPVAEYIKLRRMARATEALLKKDRRILDVALDFGFSSHEQFTRTFKDTFGITPEDYRKSPTMLSRMTKPELLLNYTLVDEGVPLITNGIFIEINRKTLHKAEHFIGRETKAPIGFIDGQGIESGVDPLLEIWNTFHGEKPGIPNLAQDGYEFGCSYASDTEGYFCYFAGAKASSPDAPQGYLSREQPAGDYIVCSFEAESFEALVMDVLYKANQYLYCVWLPSHKLTIEPFSIERYENKGKEPNKMEVWVKLI